jgi:hypothetical protein
MIFYPWAKIVLDDELIEMHVGSASQVTGHLDGGQDKQACSFLIR